jgi:hypothetical protein
MGFSLHWEVYDGRTKQLVEWWAPLFRLQYLGLWLEKSRESGSSPKDGKKWAEEISIPQYCCEDGGDKDSYPLCVKCYESLCFWDFHRLIFLIFIVDNSNLWKRSLAYAHLFLTSFRWSIGGKLPIFFLDSYHSYACKRPYLPFFSTRAFFRD